jgi:hypothetical protein
MALGRELTIEILTMDVIYHIASISPHYSYLFTFRMIK